MKITKSLVLSLFLLAFTATFPSSSFMATATHSAEDHLPEPVFDINGQKVRAGGRYFVEVKVPFTPNASALHDTPTLAFSTNKFCPYAVELSTETKFPVRISPVTSEDYFIREKTNLSIKFDMGYLCRMIISLVWGKNEDESVLTARGALGHDQFFITKYKDEKHTYRLYYCGPHAGTECHRLGYVVENGVTYVSTDGLSFPVIFRPAPEPRHMIKEVVNN